ncbi:Flp family type IVb pilin [Photobacterium sanguinicancri]|uniref:Flp family type IVb pilin n=1 Tax=Photobacterium sanguinicancri TaxID=875932 RepID=UPI003D0B6593
MKNLLTQFWNNEDGVTAIEYALIGVAMAVVVGASIQGVRDQLATTFKAIETAISSAGVK